MPPAARLLVIYLPWSQLLKYARSLLFPFRLCDPHILFIGHNVCEDGTTEEDHVASPWRVFDANFEFLRVKNHVNRLFDDMQKC